MNEQDKQAMCKAFVEIAARGWSQLQHDDFEAGWQAALEYARQQEPVAIVDASDDGFFAEILPDRDVKVGDKLYAEAPAVTINEQLYTALEGLLAITRDSQGVAGYHLNGVAAKWDEFEEVSAAEAAIAAAEAAKEGV